MPPRSSPFLRGLNPRSQPTGASLANVRIVRIVQILANLDSLYAYLNLLDPLAI
jgi:hypothetical protein